eukprot:jgi/Mesvir1/13438/Mv25626-RA.1
MWQNKLACVAKECTDTNDTGMEATGACAKVTKSFRMRGPCAGTQGPAGSHRGVEPGPHAPKACALPRQHWGTYCRAKRMHAPVHYRTARTGILILVGTTKTW